MKNLYELAEQYPFDQHRRELLELQPVKHLQGSWANQTTDTHNLANTVDDELVGWLQVDKNTLHSSHQPKKVLDCKWELINQNRNDIRLTQLHALKEKFPGTLIHLRQPTQNRNATALLYSRPDIQPGGCDLYLARWEDLSRSELPDELPATLEFIDKDQIDEVEIKNLLGSYSQGQLHTDGPYRLETVEQIYQSWAINQLRSDAYFVRGLAKRGRLIGLVISRKLPAEFPAGKTGGTIAYLQVAPGEQGEGYGELLLKKGENLLLEQNVEYIELKVNQANEPAKKFYRRDGYQLITRRSHFYFHVPEKTP